MKNPLAAVAAAMTGTFDVRPVYAIRCGGLLKSASGTMALLEKLLATQAGLKNPHGRQARLLRYQVEEVKRVADAHRLDADFGKCADLRGQAKEQVDKETVAVKTELHDASANVSRCEVLVQKREDKAAQALKVNQEQLTQAAKSTTSAVAEAERVLYEAELSDDDDAAQAAARRLHEVRMNHQLTLNTAASSPDALREDVVRRQLSDARTALAEAQTVAADLRKRLGQCELQSALLSFDESATQYARAAAQVVRALADAGPGARLPAYWKIPDVVVATVEHVPGASGMVDGFSSTVPTRVIRRMGEVMRPPDLTVFAVDPATLPDTLEENGTAGAPVAEKCAA